jgi:predicted acylesterase/phospholipase RssA
MSVASWSKALACMLVLTGCASATPLMLLRAGTGTTCITPAPEAELLIGIALSGGGSRAAVFGAAGLEALGRLRAPGGDSLLEETRYLSSVSGGSVAGAYYASHKPPKEVPILTAQGEYTNEYQAFFKLYSE